MRIFFCIALKKIRNVTMQNIVIVFFMHNIPIFSFDFGVKYWVNVLDFVPVFRKHIFTIGHAMPACGGTSWPGLHWCDWDGRDTSRGWSSRSDQTFPHPFWDSATHQQTSSASLCVCLKTKRENNYKLWTKCGLKMIMHMSAKIWTFPVHTVTA